MKRERNRIDLINEFYLAPDDTLFGQETVCAVCFFSPAKAERDRWSGQGIPFLKLGPRAVRYRKADIVIWLKQHQLYTSTSCV